MPSIAKLATLRTKFELQTRCLKNHELSFFSEIPSHRKAGCFEFSTAQVLGEKLITNFIDWTSHLSMLSIAFCRFPIVEWFFGFPFLSFAFIAFHLFPLHSHAFHGSLRKRSHENLQFKSRFHTWLTSKLYAIHCTRCMPCIQPLWWANGEFPSSRWTIESNGDHFLWEILTEKPHWESFGKDTSSWPIPVLIQYYGIKAYSRMEPTAEQANLHLNLSNKDEIVRLI